MLTLAKVCWGVFEPHWLKSRAISGTSKTVKELGMGEFLFAFMRGITGYKSQTTTLTVISSLSIGFSMYIYKNYSKSTDSL